MKATRAGGNSEVGEIRHFLRRVWLEVLNDANIVVELPHAAAAKRGAGDRQA